MKIEIGCECQTQVETVLYHSVRHFGCVQLTHSRATDFMDVSVSLPQTVS